MSADFVQFVENSQTPSTATLDTSSTPITVTAHNSLIGCSSHGSVTVNTFTSNLGSVFNKLGVGAIGGQELDFWLCQDTIGGSDFFTAHCNSGTNVQGLLAVEIVGCVTSGGAVAFAAQGINGPGAGTNTVVSPTIALGTVPAFLIGISNNRSANGVPLVGTSPITFTDRGSFWPNIGGGVRGRLEDFRQPNAGNYAATFDCNTHAGSLFIAGIIALAEIGGIPTNQTSRLSSFNLGPNPRVPFHNTQFRAFKYQAKYTPIPLFLDLEFATFTFSGQNLNLSAITQAQLVLNPGMFQVNGLPITFTLGQPTEQSILFGTTSKSGGRVVLSAKKQGEIIGYTVDFISSMGVGETIKSVVVTCTPYSGKDPNVSNMVVGKPTIQGTAVDQGIGYGVPGNIYALLYKATTNFNQVIEIAAYLLVIPDLP